MKTKIAITIDEDLLKGVDDFAEKYDLNRSRLINNLVGVALSDVKLFQRVGLMDLAIFVRSFQEKMRDRFKMRSQES